MSNRWNRTAAFALGAVAIGIYIAVSQSRHRADTVGPSQRSQDPFGNNDAGNALRNFVTVMNSQGDDAEQSYARALESLRGHAKDAVPEIARVESTLREDDYPSRFALIFAASELRHPAALPWLRSVALSRIPAERSSDTHSFSTVAEETILRTTAVEGIGRLASDNNPEATEALFECLRRPSLSIRRAAVQELLQVPEARNQRDRIAAALPEDQRFLLDLRRLDVREVPQIRSPQQFLAPGAEAGGRTTPPPSEPRSRDQPFRRTYPYSPDNPPPKVNHQ
jgi:hypothetical protein